ncbi:MAG: cytochrome c oxidase subunit 3 [Gammaproteobacteria bacterium]
MSFLSELLDKSWMTQGVAGEVNDRSVGIGPAAKTCLNFLMMVLTSMFFLFIVGYRLRMAEADWQPISDPVILWANTAILIIAGLVMQRAREAAEQSKIQSVRNQLTIAFLLTMLFLVGQYFAWQQLSASGYYIQTSPAAAFFLLLTTLHALHLAGGMFVLIRSVFRAWQGVEVARIRLSIELCTTYWHFLLLVWFVFFALLLST